MCGREGQKSAFGHVECERAVSQPDGSVKQAVGYESGIDGRSLGCRG